MKMNRMTDYAIRTISGIYKTQSNVVTSNLLSKKQGIPHGVLMKVLRMLRMGGIIKSHQGRGEVAGGYSLNKPVSEITLLEIVELMEGPIAFGKGLELEVEAEDVYPYKEELHAEYERISEVLKREMKRYTLEQILNQPTKEWRIQ